MKLSVPFHEGLQRELEAKLIETEDFGRPQWDKACGTRHLSKDHPRTAWNRNRKGATFYSFYSHSLPSDCRESPSARAGSTSAARQILAEPHALPGADRTVS